MVDLPNDPNTQYENATIVCQCEDICKLILIQEMKQCSQSEGRIG